MAEIRRSARLTARTSSSTSSSSPETPTQTSSDSSTLAFVHPQRRAREKLSRPSDLFAPARTPLKRDELFDIERAIIFPDHHFCSSTIEAAETLLSLSTSMVQPLQHRYEVPTQGALGLFESAVQVQGVEKAEHTARASQKAIAGSIHHENARPGLTSIVAHAHVTEESYIRSTSLSLPPTVPLLQATPGAFRLSAVPWHMMGRERQREEWEEFVNSVDVRKTKTRNTTRKRSAATEHRIRRSKRLRLQNAIATAATDEHSIEEPTLNTDISDDGSSGVVTPSKKQEADAQSRSTPQKKITIKVNGVDHSPRSSEKASTCSAEATASAGTSTTSSSSSNRSSRNEGSSSYSAGDIKRFSSRGRQLKKTRRAEESD